METNKTKIAITLGILCLILTLAISIQLKTMKEEDSVVSTTTVNNDLKDQMLRWKERYNKAVKEYEGTEEKLEITRNNATKNDTTAIDAEHQIKENNKILGLTDVTGDGIIITLQDNSNATGKEAFIDNYLVHDSDLRTLINELWNAGAEAISINGQRIIATTAVACDGNTIKINGETTGTPFEIKAIGIGLYGAIARPGGYYKFMEETGVNTSIRNQNNISITKYNGGVRAQYLKKVQ